MSVMSSVTKIYANTVNGVREYLSDEEAMREELIEVIYPDPVVVGVWGINLKGIESTPGMIVYLAGTPDPWGKIRTENDFEVSDEADLAIGW